MPFMLVTRTGNTLSDLNGEVLSLSPENTNPPPRKYVWTRRPAGTAGPYELKGESGGLVTYNPLGDEAVVFAFASSVPNGVPGLCAISVDPL